MWTTPSSHWPRSLASAAFAGRSKIGLCDFWALRDVILRLNGDCPLFDPEVANRAAAEVTSHRATCDCAGNVLDRTFPFGMDVEVFTYGALSWMDRLAKSPAEREQATLLPRGRLRQLFQYRSLGDDRNNADLHLDVKMPEGLTLARRLFEELDLAANPLGYRELVTHVRARADLLQLASAPPQLSPRRAAA
jgi:spore coat polysaccharide biosynthesis protein SpsF